MWSQLDLSGEGWPQTHPTVPGSRRGRPQCQAVASRWGNPGRSAFWGEEGEAVENACVSRAPAPAPALAQDRRHTFSQERGAELPSCWLSSWLRPTVQVWSSMGSSDARRNWGEQERKRVLSCPWPGPFPRSCVPGRCWGRAAQNSSLFPHPTQPSFHQLPSSPNTSGETPGTPDREEMAVLSVCHSVRGH